MSARTGGLILVQLLLDLSRAGDRADRVLDAPTSEAWIAPWVAYLRSRGVAVRLGEAVEGLVLRDGRIAGATVAGQTVAADYYVAALPVEVMRTLLSPELRARRAAAERARPAGHALDERDHVLPAETCRWCAATRSTSTPSGR